MRMRWIDEVSTDFKLEPPYRQVWGTRRKKSDWKVPALIKMYPTEPKAEVVATVQFMYPSESGDADIVELGEFLFCARIYESGRKGFNDRVCRGYSAILESVSGQRSWRELGWDPDEVYYELADWISLQTVKRIEQFIRRIDGYRFTSSVKVEYFWQLRAGD
jgi:hypothetical protein